MQSNHKEPWLKWINNTTSQAIRVATAKKKNDSPNDKRLHRKNDLCDMKNVLILFIGVAFFSRLLFIVCLCVSFQLTLVYILFRIHFFFMIGIEIFWHIFSCEFKQIFFSYHQRHISSSCREKLRNVLEFCDIIFSGKTRKKNEVVFLFGVLMPNIDCYS